MEIMALNKDFVPEGAARLRYFDLSWNRKYYETGQFSVQIKASDYSSDMKYIYSKDRPELGMIQGVEYSDDDSMVVLSGFFYEKKLADKIVYPMFSQYGTREKFVASVVEEYKSDIPRLSVVAYEDSDEKIQKQETGGSLESVAYATLKVEEKLYRCVYDYENDVINFEIYQGIDRTQEQTENNFVTFSRGFRNIKNVSAKNDNSNFKNYFVVAGNGEGSDRIFVIVDLSGGDYQQQLFVDCKNEMYDPDEQTLEEYRAALYQKGLEKAKEYVDIHNVEFDADVNAGARYLEDYDLGDKCDVVLDDIQQSYEARIIEIYEVWNSGKHTVTLTFGDKIPTLYERARVN